jgi:predicted DNA-binding protein (UPF0251 family)
MRGVDGSAAALAQRLRRLARSLAGESPAADRLALAVLEDLSRRMPLSRAFSLMIRRNRARNAVVEPGPGAGRDVVAAMAALPRELREVLALVVIEDLPYSEAARILEIDEQRLFDLLTLARQEMAEFCEASRPVVLRLVKG